MEKMRTRLKASRREKGVDKKSKRKDCVKTDETGSTSSIDTCKIKKIPEDEILKNITKIHLWK
jgi:hypothetical protein